MATKGIKNIKSEPSMIKLFTLQWSKSLPKLNAVSLNLGAAKEMSVLGEKEQEYLLILNATNGIQILP